MHIEFCECGGLLEPKAGRLRCRNCGREIAKSIENKFNSERRKEEILVIEDDKPSLPETNRECPKCQNNRAYYWLIQTRSADEPPTQFFRCTKCNHVWREYK
jgi:DNA-directed RNA polymerase subunit M